MQILTLNTWGGRAGKDTLLAFLKEQAKTTDIFCLQEVWAAPYDHLVGTVVGGTEFRNDDVLAYGVQTITEMLPEYEYFFHPHHLDNYGLLMLVKKGIEVQGSGDLFVYKFKGYTPEGDIGNHARNIQYITFKSSGEEYTVINFHGLWNGKGKSDSEDRLEQSGNIAAFLKDIKGGVVLCGDFNLLPDTKSIKILENLGLRNLVTEYGVTSTRTTFYKKSEKFADYIFINKKVRLKDFKVLKDEVSDHAPLLIVFK